MSTQSIIPIRSMTDGLVLRLASASVLARLPVHVPVVACRAPDLADDRRWRHHAIDGRTFQVAQPVTFTPYASAAPCSARCRFCSETLIEKAPGKPSSSLRPGKEYFDRLRTALRQLSGLPLSYSLSGLETTDDPEWMRGTLDVLQEHARRSPVQDRVLYTNGTGLAHPLHGEHLIDCLVSFGIDWIEFSRHHFDESANQSIMRFRVGVAVQSQQQFINTLRRLVARVPVKLVCIVQRGGIDSVNDVMRYLDWAHELGVDTVIFREFSKLDESYASNVTSRYINSTRIPVDALLEQCLHQKAFTDLISFERATEGYYFWNLVGRYRGLEVVFEASDYALMHRQHDSGRVYKLVFHANGNLCADWNPERHVLFRTDGEGSSNGRQ